MIIHDLVEVFADYYKEDPPAWADAVTSGDPLRRATQFLDALMEAADDEDDLTGFGFASLLSHVCSALKRSPLLLGDLGKALYPR